MDKIEFFKSEILRFMNYFGLKEWEIFFEQIPDNEKGNRAGCYIYPITSSCPGARMVTYKYSMDWLNTIDTDETAISKVAFHEVMELLLSDLVEFASRHDIHITEREIETADHIVIRRLENTIWEDFLKYKKEVKMAKKKGSKDKDSSKKSSKDKDSSKKGGCKK